MNAARLAHAIFRRLCGTVGYTVPPSMGDPGTPARRYNSDIARIAVVAPQLDPLVPGSRNLTDNRDRYVHTSVSHDETHAANDEGDGRPTDYVIPFREDSEGRLLDRMSGEPITRLPLF